MPIMNNESRKKRAAWEREEVEAMCAAAVHADHGSKHLRAGSYRLAEREFALASDHSRKAFHAAWMASEAPE